MNANNLNNYAKALVELAYEQKKLDLIAHQFESLIDICRDIPGFVEYLAINDYTLENHLELLKGFDPLLLRFLDVLIKNNVGRELFTIFKDFRILANKYEKQAFIKVYSAKELNENQRQQIKQNLQKLIPDKEIILVFKVDKELLAGIKILYQGKNLDYTYEKYLDDMFKNIGGNYGES